MVKTFYSTYFAFVYRNDLVLCFDVIYTKWVIG
jgi:hypothetical protein